MRILHLADIHIGKIHKETVDDFIAKTQNQKFDVAVLAGDLFHSSLLFEDDGSHQAVNFVSFLTTIASQIIIIKGTPSHDCENLESLYNFLNDLDKGHRVALALGSTEVGDFCCIPEPTLQTITETTKLLASTKCKFCLFHGNIESAKYPSGIEVDATSECCIKKSMFKKFYTVFGGHIHKQQKIAGLKAYYAGSLGRWQFGEEDPKGFYIHEGSPSDMKATFVEVHSPEYKTHYINVEDLEAFVTAHPTPTPVKVVITQPLKKTMTIPKHIKVEARVSSESVTENETLIKLSQSDSSMKEKAKIYIQEKLKIVITPTLAAALDQVMPGE